MMKQTLNSDVKMSKKVSQDLEKKFDAVYLSMQKNYEEETTGYELGLINDVLLYRPSEDKKTGKPIISFEGKKDGETIRFAICGKNAIVKIFETYNKEERTIQVPVNLSKNVKFDESNNTIWVYS